MRPVAWRPPAEQVVIKAVRRAKLFVFLRLHRHELFDEEFQAELAQAYADRPKGQPPVPPAQLALATILQAYTGVSDDEVVEATIMGLSSVGGPVLAGWLIDADYFGTSWRMIFLINLPLGLIALAGAIAFLPRGDRATASRLDVTGAILVAGAAALLVYPVVQGRTLGWPAWTFLLMGASIAMFALFGWYETRKQRAGSEPLVIPALFRKRAFTGGLVAGLAFFTAIVGFSLILTVYLQIGLGYSPLKAGLSVLPQAAGAVIGFIAAGAGLASKLGRTLIHVGTATMAVGILGVYLILRVASIPVTPWQLAPALVVMGIGMGMVLAPFFDIVLVGVESHETGSASGTLTALQQFGSALGVAVMGTIFFGLLAGHVTASVNQALPSLRTHLAASAVASPQQDTIIADLRACIHDRATATDAAAQPASCNQLDTAVHATGSTQVANLVDVTTSDAWSGLPSIRGARFACWCVWPTMAMTCTSTNAYGGLREPLLW
jgi:predicted MFS family arabinose efflux permease